MVAFYTRVIHRNRVSFAGRVFIHAKSDRAKIAQKCP